MQNAEIKRPRIYKEQTRELEKRTQRRHASPPGRCQETPERTTSRKDEEPQVEAMTKGRKATMHTTRGDTRKPEHAGPSDGKNVEGTSRNVEPNTSVKPRGTPTEIYCTHRDVKGPQAKHVDSTSGNPNGRRFHLHLPKAKTNLDR